MVATKRLRALAAAGALLFSLPLAPAVAPASPAAAPAHRVDLKPAFAEVEAWAGKAFPGAVLAVGQHGKLLALKSFGHIDSTANAPAMPKNAIFDLASLTKVVGTTSAAEILYDRGQLDLDAPVARYIPEFAGTPGHDAITVRHLLSHSSGFKPVAGLLWGHANDRAGILKQIYAMPVGNPPGTVYVYQDFNLILVGEIVSRITGQPLDAFLHKEVFGPLGMKDTGFNPPKGKLARIVPTEQDDKFRHMLVRGVVHDENAYVMGGVAGHAGLFSTAADLAKVTQLYLDHGRYKGRQIIKPETIRLFMQPQGLPAGSVRALGWDMPLENGFAGPLASPHAIIHTGFTGTSIYIDPERDAFIILLTNRVNPTRDNAGIFKARPAIHTAVLTALDAAK
ncbi:serine hydrolase [Sphingomonas sp. HITSZ_GF]|uniref:serine hydrolase domain-containing protein n=1 Tax=Sphingomonas sp. HITSZ_GF TaxID=3037247 RepID=UPI00240D2CB0|nr:serine hydrolase domain-containing protein [Sphingomonas sp. HITSZ_GF]MDG2535714.1 serine hydrolase [Sphingomonas sp. HITSZ_GF]